MAKWHVSYATGIGRAKETYRTYRRNASKRSQALRRKKGRK